MAYGWTVEQVNERTWPQVKELIRLINQMPPPAVLEGRAFYYRNYGEAAADPGGLGVPVTKGKVKRRSGDGS